MWPTFCLACLFVFVASSPTFQASGHTLFEVVSKVTSELWSTARWRECRRQFAIVLQELGQDGETVSEYGTLGYKERVPVVIGEGEFRRVTLGPYTEGPRTKFAIFENRI